MALAARFVHHAAPGDLSRRFSWDYVLRGIVDGDALPAESEQAGGNGDVLRPGSEPEDAGGTGNPTSIRNGSGTAGTGDQRLFPFSRACVRPRSERQA